MTSVKVKFRPASSAEKQGSVYYQITCKGKVRRITSGHKLFQPEWDARLSEIKTPLVSPRLPALNDIRNDIGGDISRLHRIIKRLEASGVSYSAEDVIAEFCRHIHQLSLFHYMELLISSLIRLNKIRTAETYRAALNSFRQFRKHKDILLDVISAEIMEEYEVYLRMKGNIPNTTSFYMRILRAVYNRAVSEERIDDRHPFRRVYTGVDKTIKRALPVDAIKRIKNLNLSASPKDDFARDMFMMSFYLRGMSLIDMAHLKKADLYDKYIYYRRRKTEQPLQIEWRKEMQDILDKYPHNSSDYLLPIIPEDSPDPHRAYRNAGNRINRRLKHIAAKAGTPLPLTLYCARHSWASAAKALGIPIVVISEAMGHDSESTTQIYLASLENSAIDNANSIIISSL